MAAPQLASGVPQSNSYTNSVATEPSRSTDPVTDLASNGLPAMRDVIEIPGQRLSLSDITTRLKDGFEAATRRTMDLIRQELEEAAGRLSPKATGALAGAERAEIAKGAITGEGLGPLPVTTLDALMSSLEFLTNGPPAMLAVPLRSVEPDGTLGTGSESSNFSSLFANPRPLRLAA